MSVAVQTLPTELAVTAAWDRYVALVAAQTGDDGLRVQIEHQIAIVRAWRAWRDLFLEFDRVSR